jgi:uncharacterized lipoprotein YmbA
MTRWKIALLTGLALTLCGCSGAQTRFYTLEPAPSSTGQAAYAGAPLRVDAVHIPSSLDRPEMARELENNQVVVPDNDHWAGPLGDLLRRALTQDLAARLGPQAVVYPDAPKPTGSAGLVVNILAISPVGGDLVMDVSWTLLPGQGPGPSGASPTVTRGALRVSTPRSGTGAGAYAAELSQLTDHLASAIAGNLSASR